MKFNEMFLFAKKIDSEASEDENLKSLNWCQSKWNIQNGRV